MKKTVVAIFKSINEAENAASQLLDNGFTRDNIDVSSGKKYAEDLHEGKSAISRFFDNLFGNKDEKSDRYAKVAERGYVVTVYAHSVEEAQQASSLLDDYGAIDVDENYDKHFADDRNFDNRNVNDDRRSKNYNAAGDNYTDRNVSNETRNEDYNTPDATRDVNNNRRPEDYNAVNENYDKSELNYDRTNKNPGTRDDYDKRDDSLENRNERHNERKEIENTGNDNYANRDVNNNRRNEDYNAVNENDDKRELNYDRSNENPGTRDDSNNRKDNLDNRNEKYNERNEIENTANETYANSDVNNDRRNENLIRNDDYDKKNEKYDEGEMNAEDVNENKRIPVIEEDIQVGKKEVITGGVRIRSRIVETPFEENLRLREEHIHVERNKVNRPATEEEISNFKSGTIEFNEHAEIPDVQKRSMVVEEVSLGKEVEHRDETVRDKVRKTEVDIENIDPDDTRSNP